MAVDEILDLFDENENHIGTERYSVIHRDKLWHRVFHCWISIKDADKGVCVLFQRRGSDVSNPLKLDISAAGHLKAGETVADGVREITEEIGVMPAFEELIDLGMLKWMHSAEFAYTYLYKYTGNIEDLLLQESEVADMFYAPLPDLQAFFGGKTTQITLYDYKDKSPHIFTWEHFIPHYPGYYTDIMNKIEAAHT